METFYFSNEIVLFYNLRYNQFNELCDVINHYHFINHYFHNLLLLHF